MVSDVVFVRIVPIFIREWHFFRKERQVLQKSLCEITLTNFEPRTRAG